MRSYARAHLFWCSVLIFDHANPMIFIFCGPFKAGCVFARTGASARIKFPCGDKVARSTRCASVGGGGILSAFVRSSCTPAHVYLGVGCTSARFWLRARWRGCRALLSALVPAGSGAGGLAGCAFCPARRRRFLGGFMRCAARVKHQCTPECVRAPRAQTTHQRRRLHAWRLHAVRAMRRGSSTSTPPNACARRVPQRRTCDTASTRGVCTPCVRILLRVIGLLKATFWWGLFMRTVLNAVNFETDFRPHCTSPACTASALHFTRMHRVRTALHPHAPRPRAQNCSAAGAAQASRS